MAVDGRTVIEFAHHIVDNIPLNAVMPGDQRLNFGDGGFPLAAARPEIL